MTNRDPDSVWRDLLHRILVRGEEVSPRGRPCLEIVASSTVWSMEDPVIKDAGRRLGYRFMPAEAAWILSGDNRVSSIAPYSKSIGKFSDDGVRFFGAYGPQVVDQLTHVVETLVRDPESRQAVISIWRESPPLTLDTPCTLSLQFMVRGARLHCVAEMRSSDAWLGVVYDVFNFSQVAAAVAIELRSRGVETIPGDLFLRAGSQHLYEDQYEQAGAIVENESDPLHGCLAGMAFLDPSLFDSVDRLVEHLWALAERDRSRTMIPYALELVEVKR